MMKKTVTSTKRYQDFVRRKIKIFNKNIEGWYNGIVYKKNNDYIVFPTYVHAHLWIDEILGQLSDGAWENVNSKWEYFDSLEVKVRPGSQKTYIVGKVPYHDRFDYEEIMFLFENGGRALGKSQDVRNVFSEKRFPYEELERIMKDIFRATNRRG